MPPMLTNSFLRLYVSQMATHQSRERKLHLLSDPAFLDSIPSSVEQMRGDWHNACEGLTLQLAEGDIPLALIASDAYYLLEGAWWKEVKQMSAYHRWKKAGNGTPERHYHDASKALRDRLFGGRRADLRDFENVRTYITGKYLDDDNGRLAEKTKAEARSLINNKAWRIWQTTGETRPIRNWFRARMYTAMFYENIIGAVIDNDAQKAVGVLRAFEYSKAPTNRYLIINGFEAVVAISFLDKELMKFILNDSASFDFSCVPVDGWPEHVQSPSTCAAGFQYDADQKQITYVGRMTEQEREGLIGKVSHEEHKIAISHLYEQSHFVPYEDMVL